MLLPHDMFAQTISGLGLLLLKPTVLLDLFLKLSDLLGLREVVQGVGESKGRGWL